MMPVHDLRHDGKPQSRPAFLRRVEIVEDASALVVRHAATGIGDRHADDRPIIASIGELILRTADELLEAKNFGMTSLNEVREKLATYGLTLRGD